MSNKKERIEIARNIVRLRPLMSTEDRQFMRDLHIGTMPMTEETLFILQTFLADVVSNMCKSLEQENCVAIRVDHENLTVMTRVKQDATCDDAQKKSQEEWKWAHKWMTFLSHLESV